MRLFARKRPWLGRSSTSFSSVTSSFSSPSPRALMELDQETTRRLYKLISAFRDRGHYAAELDPLSSVEERPSSWLPADPRDQPDVVRLLRSYRSRRPTAGHLDLEPFGLQDLPRDSAFLLANELKTQPPRHTWTLNELVTFLVDTYCSSVGVEYSHIENDLQRTWLEERVEGRRNWKLRTPHAKLNAWEQLLRTDLTATFLNRAFPNSKVFGLEGNESLIPGLHAFLQRASSLGCGAIEMGMAHRGRMNVLHNFLGKPLESICATFAESDPSELGDVKYHLGTRSQLSVRDVDEGGDAKERTVHVSLAANPSHLEAVNPVVIGKCKAKQFFIDDLSMKSVCPLLLHGDASFSGQGIVAETMEMTSNSKDYTVGGTVHVVINNQVGFTTDPRSMRTSYHCTNSAKGVGAPIFHVNSDDVEAVVSVCRLAIEYRQQFGKDVVIDIVGYRRNGHNSQDDPSSTQPQTYQLIDLHPPVLQIFTEKLLSEGVLNQQMIDEMIASISNEQERAIKASQNYVPDPLEWLASNWQGAAIGSMLSTRPYNQTGVRLSVLQTIGKSLTYVPPDFEIHKDILKLLKSRQKMMETGEGITMAMAEALAFGCLMSKFSPADTVGLRGLTSEKRTIEETQKVESSSNIDVQMQEHPSVHIRLSGQDVIRGTFNQRHSAIFDQKSDRIFWQLNNLQLKEQAKITVCNSMLSEAAVLGFEYGYSLSNEMALTIWEAQFGDFSNNSQVIIDNFIASGEHKWNNRSSLVLLLPHGLDGQGPEHSSGRIERYLQLVDDDEDSIPGKNAFTRAEMVSSFNALDVKKNGVIEKAELSRALMRLNAGVSSERIDLTLTEIMTELGTADTGVMSKMSWFRLMEAYCLQNAERKGNLIVIVPSTPAQYFHSLRRQIHRPFSKPLVVFSGKWLLHHRACISKLEDLTVGTFFHRIIVEDGIGDNMQALRKRPLVSDNDIRRVIFCSGKVFYHLFHAREAAGITDVTIVRVEQLAPFPYDLLTPTLARYPNADIVWAQEEPKNMGAWTYVRPRLVTVMRENRMNIREVKFVGRKPSSSPASGGYKMHLVEQKEFVDECLRLD